MLLHVRGQIGTEHVRRRELPGDEPLQKALLDIVLFLAHPVLGLALDPRRLGFLRPAEGELAILKVGHEGRLVLRVDQSVRGAIQNFLREIRVMGRDAANARFNGLALVARYHRLASVRCRINAF